MRRCTALHRIEWTEHFQLNQTELLLLCAGTVTTYFAVRGCPLGRGPRQKNGKILTELSFFSLSLTIKMTWKKFEVQK